MVSGQLCPLRQNFWVGIGQVCYPWPGWVGRGQVFITEEEVTGSVPG